MLLQETAEMERKDKAKADAEYKKLWANKPSKKRAEPKIEKSIAESVANTSTVIYDQPTTPNEIETVVPQTAYELEMKRLQNVQKHREAVKARAKERRERREKKRSRNN